MNRRLLWIGLVIAALAVLASLALAVRVPAPPVLPSPNAYLDIVLASRQLQQSGWQAPDSPSTTNSRGVSPPAEPLRLARAKLDQPGAVPTQFTSAYLASHMNDLIGLKRLAQAFAVEAGLLLNSGHTNQAASSALDAIRLAAAATRNGLMIDALVGIALEHIGQRRLEPCVAGLSLDDSRRLVAVLSELDSALSDPQPVIQQDRRFGLGSTPLHLKPWVVFQHLYPRSQVRGMESSFVDKVRDVTRRRRRLILQVAGHAYSLESGQTPDRATDLVPRYLRELPRDPASGQPLSLTR